MRHRALLLGLSALLIAVLAPISAAQAAAPVYDVRATWGDTYLPPGGKAEFRVQVRNIGDGTAEKAFAITDELPPGVKVTKIEWRSFFENRSNLCSGVGTETASCVLPKSEASLLPAIAGPPGLEASGLIIEPGQSGYVWPIYIEVEVEPGVSGTAINTARVSGGGAPEATDVNEVHFSDTPAPFGIVPGSFHTDVFKEAYPGQATSRRAGDHPFEQRVEFEITAKSTVSLVDGTRMSPPSGSLQTAQVTLPRGLIGNPEAMPKCDPLDFVQKGAVNNGTRCPSNTQVGYMNILNIGGAQNHGNGGIGNSNELLSRVPIYSLIPPKGTPVDLAFNAQGLVQTHIYATLDPSQNYAIKALTPNLSSLVGISGSQVTLWGVPGDPAHDRLRYYPKSTGGQALGAPFTAPIRPFFTNPSDCGFDNGGHRIRVDSYQDPGNLTPVEEYPDPLNVTGCDDPRFRFEPKTSLQPTTRDAGAPIGLDVHLEIPQRNDEVDEASKLYAENGFVKGIGTPPMKKAIVTFPQGMTLNPAAAQGLGSCSPEQIGLGTAKLVTCPDNSQYGKLILHTPALPVDAQPEGFIYIAKQGDNPFHNFLSLYLVIEEPERGILVKIPGRLDLDPQTGQITTTFDDLPQFPVSDMQMTFKGGVRAGLVNPSTCGTKTIKAEFFSWHDPQTPHVVDSSYDITRKPDGSPCVNSLGERPFKPQMDAGTISPSAGAYSPFTFRLTRTDDDQEFSQIGVDLPQGLAAKFAGVSICSNADIGKALSRETTAGAGALEQSNPSCPASSQIGSTQVGTGVGVPLTYVPGKVYLAGPYKGAPLSMVVISPALVGPYDLGVIAVRTAIEVDPVTATAQAVSDPFPQIFQGIPVRIRDIRLNLDRPSFTLNPTSCAPKQITAHVTGTGGNVASTADDTGADLANRFQAADCASLGFKPSLSFRLFGGTKRGSHPRFQATLRARPGDANIAGASVALPHSEFLDQAHIKTVCTRVQFAASNCPAGSVYGYAVAKTPLFDQPIQGPVYLRSSSHQLPDLVAALKGPDSQPIEVDLSGRIDSVNGGIRNTFEVVPDAPVSTFTLTMQGGKKGLLINSTDLCKSTNKATAKFTGQNGKKLTLHPALQSACGKAKRGGKGKHKG